MSFDSFFTSAAGHFPYPYQRCVALDGQMPALINIPTGLGKTAAVILAWLWRRRFADETVRSKTPRRLVYCLPMRTLVEQTQEECVKWLKKLQLDEEIGVHMLMGGASHDDWDLYPERDAILIGTQDMLLSRVLNRGYGMSRYRWPMHFAMLNNDCLWVLDETQLMGVGLTTSAQLAGLRKKMNTYGTTQTLWMSATLDREAIQTVDHSEPMGDDCVHSLKKADREFESVKRLWRAGKPIEQCSLSLSVGNENKYEEELAAAVVKAHEAGTLTLVILNRVARAQGVFRAIQKSLAELGDDARPELSLIHSRFRPYERGRIQQQALDEKTISKNGPGRILVATQAIEAGVDISATTLFTELAPWSSLVQRFGRCNRRGTCGIDSRPAARIYWIDIDTADVTKTKGIALPYAAEELSRARKRLLALPDVGPQSLAGIEHVEPRPVYHTLRRKDLLELWDTTPDLAGNDLDVSRYIRETDDTDVQVYWRVWSLNDENGKPPAPKDDQGNVVFPAATREELCSVSIGAAKLYLKKLSDLEKKNKLFAGKTWCWNALERQWESVRDSRLRPGMVLLLHVEAGGYDETIGWTGDPKHEPEPRPPANDQNAVPGSMDDDHSGKAPLLLTQHLTDVTCAADELQKQLKQQPDGIPWEPLLTAAGWHDVGKAHPAFQNAMVNASEPTLDREKLWAKSGTKKWLTYQMPGDQGDRRPGFRHELASVLAWLTHHDGEPNADLVAFLIAAHHGKVRGSIRSLPNEAKPKDPTTRFARGLWEGDEIPMVELGNGKTTHPVTIDLSLMELGEYEDPQGNSRRSWLARVLKLRDKYGPFRLAYLETLMRIADRRGSKKGDRRNGD